MWKICRLKRVVFTNNMSTKPVVVSIPGLNGIFLFSLRQEPLLLRLMPRLSWVRWFRERHTLILVVLNHSQTTALHPGLKPGMVTNFLFSWSSFPLGVHMQSISHSLFRTFCFTLKWKFHLVSFVNRNWHQSSDYDHTWWEDSPGICAQSLLFPGYIVITWNEMRTLGAVWRLKRCGHLFYHRLCEFRIAELLVRILPICHWMTLAFQTLFLSKDAICLTWQHLLVEKHVMSQR